MVNTDLITFSISCVGYSHLKSGKICQDYSSDAVDGGKAIITACDGHGGALYIRSHLGSRYASEAAARVLGSIDAGGAVSADKIRLEVLCAWNEMVEKDVENLFGEDELSALTEENRRDLEKNPFHAYGTTLHGAAVDGDKLICVSIGDGGIFGIKDGGIVPLLDDDDEETVANITYSMCEENAGKHLKVGVFDFGEFDGVLICTDGTVNPYSDLENFNRSFVVPVVREMQRGNSDKVGRFMQKLGAEIGIGDDVSLAMILKPADLPKDDADLPKDDDSEAKE